MSLIQPNCSTKDRLSAGLFFLVGLLLLTANTTTADAQNLQTSPAPSLSLSANGRINARIFQGSALILQASLYHSNLFSKTTLVTPLLIAASNGSWENNVRLVVADGKGAQQNWPIQ